MPDSPLSLISRGQKRILMGLLWLMVMLALTTQALAATTPVTPTQSAEPVRVGVLATRGQDPARRQWQPLLDWLTQSVPGQDFELVPLALDGLAEAVADERIDFVITNPGQLVSLSRQYPLSWLATLKSPDGGDNLVTGAALVVRADAPYLHWRELEGETVAAVSKEAFGGYLAYRFEAYQQGVRIDDFFAAIDFTGFPLDRLISQLQSGAVAAAIVPVCQLERMVREGKVAEGAFRVLDQQATTGLGCQSSTRLYPNWSMASTQRVAPELALAVTRALFALPPDSSAAVGADSAGWTVPASPLAIDRLLKELDRHPLQSPWWQEAWHWLRQHRQWGWGALLLIGLLAGHHLLLQHLFNRSQRRLSRARQRIDEQARQLDDKVRQLEQAQHLARLGELGATMAHEINQPLTAIAGYSQGALLRLTRQAQGSPDPALRQALEQIGQQVERISQTIGRLRSRWQKRPRQPEPTDLQALITQLIPLLEQLLTPLGVSLHLSWQGQPRRLLLDATGMEQLLVNLIRNGAESAAQAGAAEVAGEEPRVELLIAFEQDRLRLEVRDNGPGLPEAQWQQPFYSSKPDGMGLGLAICRDVVECHRGHFSLINASPRGCLALVLIPAPMEVPDAPPSPRN